MHHVKYGKKEKCQFLQGVRMCGGKTNFVSFYLEPFVKSIITYVRYVSYDMITADIISNAWNQNIRDSRTAQNSCSTSSPSPMFCYELAHLIFVISFHLLHITPKTSNMRSMNQHSQSCPIQNSCSTSPPSPMSPMPRICIPHICHFIYTDICCN